MYKNYPILNELTDFMNIKNFREIRRVQTDEDFLVEELMIFLC
jgi:hypothetical protein